MESRLMVNFLESLKTLVISCMITEYCMVMYLILVNHTCLANKFNPNN